MSFPHYAKGLSRPFELGIICSLKIWWYGLFPDSWTGLSFQKDKKGKNEHWVFLSQVQACKFLLYIFHLVWKQGSVSEVGSDFALRIISTWSSLHAVLAFLSWCSLRGVITFAAAVFAVRSNAWAKEVGAAEIISGGSGQAWAAILADPIPGATKVLLTSQYSSSFPRVCLFTLTHNNNILICWLSARTNKPLEVGIFPWVETESKQLWRYILPNPPPSKVSFKKRIRPFSSCEFGLKMSVNPVFSNFSLKKKSLCRVSVCF